jgi:hypothetical protein
MDILPRQFSTSRVEDFIAQFERSGGQPDRWEGERLMRALGFLSAGDFDNCERELSLAETPVESRPPQYVANTPSLYPPLTTSEHRANLERIKARYAPADPKLNQRWQLDRDPWTCEHGAKHSVSRSTQWPVG